MKPTWWHPKNWLSDPDLKRCSRAARSFWFDAWRTLYGYDTDYLEAVRAAVTMP